MIVCTVVIGFLVYYWTIFSGRIDNLLKGEVFTRSAGIYAAPKQLRVGQTLTPERLIEFLKHAGYVEKAQQADQARGRYSLGDGNVDIEPSDNTTVDGQRQFQHVRVQFARNGKTISGTHGPRWQTAGWTKAWIEPGVDQLCDRTRAR